MGFGVDIINAVADISGLKVQMLPTSDFAATIPGLRSRQIASPRAQPYLAGRRPLTSAPASASPAPRRGHDYDRDRPVRAHPRGRRRYGRPDLQPFSKQRTSTGKPAIKIVTYYRETLGDWALRSGCADVHAASLGYLLRRRPGILDVQAAALLLPAPARGLAFPNGRPVVSAALNKLIADGDLRTDHEVHNGPHHRGVHVKQRDRDPGRRLRRGGLVRLEMVGVDLAVRPSRRPTLFSNAVPGRPCDLPVLIDFGLASGSTPGRRG